MTFRLKDAFSALKGMFIIWIETNSLDVFRRMKRARKRFDDVMERLHRRKYYNNLKGF